jgi:hypothetical protein
LVLGGSSSIVADTAAAQELAYDKFLDSESIDVNLVLGGSSSIVADTPTVAARYGDTKATQSLRVSTSEVNIVT